MPKAVITGATGYIGSHLAKYLIRQDWEIALILRPGSRFRYFADELTNVPRFEFDDNINDLINFFSVQNPDVVMHVASAVINTHDSDQLSELIDSNIKFGASILEAMTKSGISLFINTGSYWQNYDESDYNPVNLYAATKEAFEKIIKYYTEVAGIRAITLRLFDVYGEDDLRPKIWNILKDSNSSSPAITMTRGEQIVKLTYIDDVVKAYDVAYQLLRRNHRIKNQIYRVVSEENYTLREIVGIFEKAVNQEFNIKWGAKSYPQRYIKQPSQKYDILPEWKIETSLDMGFNRFKFLKPKIGGGNSLFINALSLCA